MAPFSPVIRASLLGKFFILFSWFQFFGQSKITSFARAPPSTGTEEFLLEYGIWFFLMISGQYIIWMGRENRKSSMILYILLCLVTHISLFLMSTLFAVFSVYRFSELEVGAIPVVMDMLKMMFLFVVEFSLLMVHTKFSCTECYDEKEKKKK